MDTDQIVTLHSDWPFLLTDQSYGYPGVYLVSTNDHYRDHSHSRTPMDRPTRLVRRCISWGPDGSVSEREVGVLTPDRARAIVASSAGYVHEDVGRVWDITL